MTREEERRVTEMMKAYADVKAVENEVKKEDEFYSCGKYLGSGSACDQVTKQEPKYRPFRDRGECWNEMLNHHPFGWIKDGCKHINMIGLCESEVELLPDQADADFDLVKNYIPFHYMFQTYVFADGAPFGIKEDTIYSDDLKTVAAILSCQIEGKTEELIDRLYEVKLYIEELIEKSKNIRVR